MPSLYLLSFRNNRIEELPADAFKNIVQNGEKLHLSLQGIIIKTIDDATFRGYNKIASVDLSKNRLRTISKELFQGIAVGSLDLQRNNISCVEDETIASMKNVMLTSLGRNPLSDECKPKIRKTLDVTV